MTDFNDNSRERYAVYPNESIDKTTVNRPLERLFEDIESKTGQMELEVKAATEKSYGKARFSASEEYSFEGSEDEDYNGAMLKISQLSDMSRRMSFNGSESMFVAPTSVDGTSTTEISSNAFWVKADYMDSRFIFMPNGVNVVTCSFDIGFNGLDGALGGEGIAYSDIVRPVSLSSYDDVVNIDGESLWNIEDYINENPDALPDINDVSNLEKLDGMGLAIPFVETVGVTLRHNKCGFTKYSAYTQSYVEVCMSMNLSVKSLYSAKYDINSYATVDDSSMVYESAETKTGEPPRKMRLFTQKPMTMAQIGFFNNQSNPKLIFGFDNHLDDVPEAEKTSLFHTYCQISQKPLDEAESEGNMISPLNGSVIVKDVSNVYDRDGNIVDNIVRMDIIMKFMAGSPSDPNMEYALKQLNTRSRVQLSMIGV